MEKIKKQSKIISVRLPTDLITAVSLLSDKSKYLTMSNIIKFIFYKFKFNDLVMVIVVMSDIA